MGTKLERERGLSDTVNTIVRRCTSAFGSGRADIGIRLRARIERDAATFAHDTNGDTASSSTATAAIAANAAITSVASATTSCSAESTSALTKLAG